MIFDKKILFVAKSCDYGFCFGISYCECESLGRSWSRKFFPFLSLTRGTQGRRVVTQALSLKFFEKV